MRTREPMSSYSPNTISRILYIPQPLSYLSYPIPLIPPKKTPSTVSPPSTTRQILHSNTKPLSSAPPPSSLKPPKATAACPRPARITKVHGVSIPTLSPTPTAVENCRTRSCPDGKRQEQKSLVWVLVEEVGYMDSPLRPPGPVIAGQNPGGIRSKR